MRPTFRLCGKSLACVCASLAILFSIPAVAQTARSAKPAAFVAVNATVTSDNAIVYEHPDFDSKVIGHLPTGKAIRVSRGTAGDQVKFHKVRAGTKLGYIADIDIAIEGARPPKKPKSELAENDNDKASKKDGRKKEPKNASRDESKETAKERERERRLRAEPMFFSHFVGILIGETWYKEGIVGVQAGDTLLMYGLKITGPGVLFNGPVMDLNFAFHYGAPSYYQPLSSTSPSGFLLLADGLFLVPFVQNHDSMVYFGVGPLFLLSDFKVTNSSRQMDLTTLNLGAAFSLGMGVRFDHASLRLEGKYYLEKQSYYAVQASVQTDY